MSIENTLARRAKYAEKPGNNGFGLTTAQTAQLANWPTTTRDHKDGQECPNVALNALLGRTVWLSNWPTAAADASGGGQPKRALPEARHGSNLNDFAMLAAWPSPTVGNATGSQAAKDASVTGKRADGSKVTVSLNAVAKVAHWPTTTTSDAASSGAMGYGGNQFMTLTDAAKITGQVRLTASGELLTGSTVVTKNGGQLNPAHSRWLMGLPAAWDVYAPTETASFYRKRRLSSGNI